MRATVIISTYLIENMDLVINCIRSVRNQTIPPYEILLILDDDLKLLDYYKKNMKNSVKIISSGGYGLSKARNAGVKNAKGDIVVFIDDDAIASKNWLKNHVENYANSDVVGVGGIAKAIWEDKRPIWFPEELDWIVGCTYKGHPEEKGFIRNPIGCNMSFRKEIINLMGHFNVNLGRFGNNLVSAEETELSIRILNAVHNSKMIYDPNIVVYHRVTNKRANIKYVLIRAYQEGISKSIIKNSYKTINMEKENEYLLYLIKKAIPLRLKKFYSFKEMSQLITLIIVIFMVMMGYIIGRTRIVR